MHDISDEEFELLIEESMARQARPMRHQHIGNLARVACVKLNTGLYEAKSDEVLAMFIFTEKNDVHCSRGDYHSSCLDSGRYLMLGIHELNAKYDTEITNDSWGRTSCPA